MSRSTREGDELLELQEWDANRPSEVTIQPTPSAFLEGHWELAGLYLGVLFFGMWFGMTGERFEDVMGFCTLSVITGFCIFILGRFGTEDLIRTNTKQILYLSFFFAFSVCVFHFIRLKVDPPNLL
jgi:hypothetical protein